MSAEGQNEVVIPSNPADRKKLLAMLEEAVSCLRKADLEKVSKKEIVAEIKNQFNLPPKFSNKLIKAMHKSDFDQTVAEHEDFEALYETVVAGNFHLANFRDDDNDDGADEDE
jgi:hypothetical protein